MLSWKLPSEGEWMSEARICYRTPDSSYHPCVQLGIAPMKATRHWISPSVSTCGEMGLWWGVRQPWSLPVNLQRHLKRNLPDTRLTALSSKPLLSLCAVYVDGRLRPQPRNRP